MNFLKSLIDFCARKECTLNTIFFPGHGIPDSYDEAVKWMRETSEYPISIFDMNGADLEREFVNRIDEVMILRRLRDPKFEVQRPATAVALSVSGSIIDAYNRDLRQIKRIREFLEEATNVMSYSLDSYSVTIEFDDPLNLEDMFDEIITSEDIPFILLGRKRKISTSFRGDSFPNWFMTDAEESTSAVGSSKGPPSGQPLGQKLMCRVKNFDLKITPGSLSFRCESLGYKHSEEIISLLGISTGYKVAKRSMICTGTIGISHVWKYHILADIITNDFSVSEVACVLEASKPLYERRHMNFSCVGVRCTVSEHEDGVRVRLSDARGRSDAALAMFIVSKIFKIYDERYEEINDVYKELESPSITRGKSPPKELSQIKALRSEVPDLFIENYTREATFLPKILSDEEAAEHMDHHKDTLVIYYPKENGRWYTSPDEDHFVGLKLNRLKNRDVYPYIITCYDTNHMERKGSLTYKYYNQDLREPPEKRSKKRRSPLPAPIRGDFGLDDSYYMIKMGSFLDCIETALGNVNECDITPRYEVVRQELRSSDGDPDLFFRYFEEMYRCSIIVIEVGESYSLDPPKGIPEPYFWKEPYGRGIILIKHSKMLYHELDVSYELVVRNDGIVFDYQEPFFSSIVEAKSERCSYSEEPDLQGVVVQYINEKGKCGMVKTKDGYMVRCSSRPLNLPCEKFDGSVIRKFFDDTNKLMKRVDIPRRKWRTTTEKELFFPDRESFNVYYSKRGMDV
ncbi:MAG: hypothetical protein JWR43_2837 [Phenylobacterium sp.]|jgi:hypothetical protein|nr:hypothetical protein [Phenylobacterium sp.]